MRLIKGEYWDEKKLTSKRIEKQMRFFFDRFPYKGKLFFYYAWKYRCVIFPESRQKHLAKQRS